jgi:branched-chain amino acid transport system substrate-binding protein
MRLLSTRRALLALAGAALTATAAHAQDSVKIGLILPMTGQQATTGRQIDAAIKLYLAKNGTTVAGRKIEVLLKDDTSVPDVAKRLAQDVVVNDKAAVLMGFGLTPIALATAPIATQAKVPQIVTAAATAMITEASPYIVRTSFTLPQASVPTAEWAFKNGIKKVVTLVSDYGPGLDAEKWFSETLKGLGGEVENLRVPLRSPDFAPILQRAADAKPDAIFVFVPSGAGAQFMKQYRERGLDKSGIKLIGTGDVTDDDQLDAIGDVALGVITVHHYSANHDSPENKAFVADFKKANNGLRPNFMAVAGYDGMHLVFEALKKTNGDADGDKLIAAMKGMSWTSPRGPMSIDPDTRDVVHTMYIREVKKVDGELHNVEFASIPDVKDPYKAGKK